MAKKKTRHARQQVAAANNNLKSHGSPNHKGNHTKKHKTSNGYSPMGKIQKHGKEVNFKEALDQQSLVFANDKSQDNSVQRDDKLKAKKVVAEPKVISPLSTRSEKKMYDVEEAFLSQLVNMNKKVGAYKQLFYKKQPYWVKETEHLQVKNYHYQQRMFKVRQEDNATTQIKTKINLFDSKAATSVTASLVH